MPSPCAARLVDVRAHRLSNKPTIIRCLDFNLLRKSPPTDSSKIASCLRGNCIRERTIYRYLLMLQAVDFLIEKDFENMYFIMSNEDEPGQKEFTTEEMKLVKKLIQSEVDENPLRAQLLRKLSLNSELDKVPRIILKARLGKLIERTAGAIHQKKQII